MCRGSNSSPICPTADPSFRVFVRSCADGRCRSSTQPINPTADPFFLLLVRSCADGRCRGSTSPQSSPGPSLHKKLKPFCKVRQAKFYHVCQGSRLTDIFPRAPTTKLARFDPSWFAAVQMAGAAARHSPYALQLTPFPLCSFDAVQMANADPSSSILVRSCADGRCRTSKSAELTGTDVLLKGWSRSAILKRPSFIMCIRKVALQKYFYGAPPRSDPSWFGARSDPSWFAAVQMAGAAARQDGRALGNGRASPERATAVLGRYRQAQVRGLASYLFTTLMFTTLSCLLHILSRLLHSLHVQYTFSVVIMFTALLTAL